jgi:hypothetical protein
MRKSATYLILALCALLISYSTYAKSIDLYDEPKDSAKKIGVIDSSTGIIPIFTPDKSSWIKVADPRNGNVGWVKMNDLNSEKSTEYTFTQRLINTGNTPQTYQVIQFGSPNKLTSDQVKEMLKKQQVEQQQLQENINRSMQKMLNEMNNLYHWNSTWFNHDMPFIMPVIVIPSHETSEATGLKNPASKK